MNPEKDPEPDPHTLLNIKLETNLLGEINIQKILTALFMSVTTRNSLPFLTDFFFLNN